MIQPTTTFKDNLALLAPVEGVARVELRDDAGSLAAVIENQPGKQGSLAVYQHLAEHFDALDAEAASFGLALFAEHTADARARPGAHPNVDRLLSIAAGEPPLRIEVVRDPQA